MKWISMGALALALAFGSCSTGTGLTEDPYYADVPDWAPYYDPSIGARYYYMPDMLTYYDVYSGQFIYWNGFNWSFSPAAPFGYTPYDLGNTYIVVLDHNVHDPWMRHNYYSTVYPKGYYYGPHNLAQPRGVQPYRGYNENSNSPITPGDYPSLNKPRPSTVPNNAPGYSPNTTAPSTHPGTIRPGADYPRQSTPPQQMRQPDIQPQPRVQPAPQAPRNNPAPQQRTMPAPKVGERRPGAR